MRELAISLAIVGGILSVVLGTTWVVTSSLQAVGFHCFMFEQGFKNGLHDKDPKITPNDHCKYSPTKDPSNEPG